MPPWADWLTSWFQFLLIVGAVLALALPPVRSTVKRFLGVERLEAATKAAEDAAAVEPVNVWAPFADAEELRDHVVERVQVLRDDVHNAFEEMRGEIRNDHTELREQGDRVESLEVVIRNGLEQRVGRIEEKVDKLVEGQARMEGRLGGGN